MNPKTTQLLTAFLLGAIVPSLMLNLSQRLQKSPAATEASHTATTITHRTDVTEVYVQMLDGSVIPMELEDYVLCVVLGEMPADFEMEALKAQAVVARTYTLKRREEGTRHPMGAVCAESACCQAYVSQESYLAAGGTHADLEKIRAAVTETAGQVLTYHGTLIEATYFSCSGGRTEDAAAVWGSDVPYLQSVDSPGEEQAAKYTAAAFFTREELESRLGVKLYGSPDNWFSAITYTEGGGVAALTVGDSRFTGVELRKRLALNSTAFGITAGADGVIITTLGHGHRVGMSQYGAEAMAVAGSTWEQILFYYYRGTRIDKFNALG